MNARVLRLTGLAASVLAALSACSTTGVDAQWVDPQRSITSLRGTTVLVVCEADEQVVRQLCQDRLLAEVNTAGGRAVLLSADEAEAGRMSSGSLSSPGRYLAPARRAQASAVLQVIVAPGESTERSGFSIGFGMGGGFGGGGFGGIGVLAPLGGWVIAQNYVANSSLSDAQGGRLLWTARASSRAGDSVTNQVGTLGRSTVEGLRRAGFF